MNVWLILEIAREAMLLAVNLYSSDKAELAEAARWFATAVGAQKEVGFQVEGGESKFPSA